MLDSDNKLNQKIELYQNLGKENPNVDVSMLMLNALEHQRQNMVSDKAKHWAYLISISLPPFGMIFAAKFFFGDEDDARQVAWICVILTAVSLLIFYFGAKLLFNTAGVSPQQIEQIKPSDIQQVLQ